MADKGYVLLADNYEHIETDDDGRHVASKSYVRGDEVKLSKERADELKEANLVADAGSDEAKKAREPQLYRVEALHAEADALEHQAKQKRDEASALEAQLQPDKDKGKASG